MEVSFEPLQIDNISTMNKNCITDNNSIYDECSICCESFTNKSFINECLHPFCYQCIIDWTKVKAVCPLCIGPITSVLHNIRSQDDYDIEKVEPPRVDVLANIDNDFIFDIDDTDTESSYGGMESMDMESDYDDSIVYENDFDDVNYDNVTGNFFGYLSNNDSSHDDASVHSNEHEENEDDVEAEVEEDNDSSSSGQEDELEDDDEDDRTHELHEYYNVGSESEAENEHADDEYDCDSNDDNDVEVDGEFENDNDNNYFDNYDEDEDDELHEEDELEQEYSSSSDDNDANDVETFDVSDESSEDPDVEYNPTSTSDDEYY